MNMKNKKINLDEKYFFMLLSESSLKKTWNNECDNKWDDVL